MTLSSRFPTVAVALLSALVGLGALLALIQAVQDAWSTGQVYLPRISRGRPAEVVEWQKSVVYLGALLAWSVGGALSLLALRDGRRFGNAAFSSFLFGAFLFLFSSLHIGLVSALIAAVVAFVCFAGRIGPAWLPVGLCVLAFMGVVYAVSAI